MSTDYERKMRLHTEMFKLVSECEGLPAEMLLEVAVSVAASAALLARKSPSEMSTLVEDSMTKIASNRKLLLAGRFMGSFETIDA